MDTATLDYLRQLADNIDKAKHGEVTPLIDKAAVFLNCSNKQVYAKLKEAGLSKTRKPRSDKGKSTITKEQAQLVSAMLTAGVRNNDKRILTIKSATAILQADGKLPNVNPTTVSRMLKANHYHPDQLCVPKAHNRMRSLYPNHVWQIDPSVCVLFYLPKEKGGGLTVMEQDEFYKNKLHNIVRTIDQRVTRYVITDHYSGSIYVEYVMGTESAENITQVFINAIQRRNANDPMHGICDILVLDKGSANTSHFFMNLAERLGIKTITHEAGNSRAKGSVEKANDIVEKEFESRLRFYKCQSLDQLNQLATNWRIDFNHKAIHTRHRKTRNAVWLTIVQKRKLKLAPSIEICRELVTTKPKTIKVRGDLTITHTIKGYPNQAYSVAHLPNIYVKAEVQVIVNPYHVPNVHIHWQGNIYDIAPLGRDEAGFYTDATIFGEAMTTQADSIADKNRKANLQTAYGVTSEADAKKARKNRQIALEGQINIMADIKANNVPSYLIGGGIQSPIETTKRHLEPLSHVVAAQTIKGLIGDLWQKDHYQQLVNQYPNGVPAEDIETIADSIHQNNTLQPINYLKVVNQ